MLDFIDTLSILTWKMHTFLQSLIKGKSKWGDLIKIGKYIILKDKNAGNLNNPNNFVLNDNHFYGQILLIY